VEDLLDNATHISAAFGVVDGTELDGSFACPVMGLENGGFTLPLCLSNVETTDSFHESKGGCALSIDHNRFKGIAQRTV